MCNAVNFVAKNEIKQFKDYEKTGGKDFDKEFYNVSAKGIIQGKDLSLMVENGHNKRLFSKRTLGEQSAKKRDLYFLQVVLSKNCLLYTSDAADE